MLLENFYKIIHRKEREDGKREIEIELNPGHALYQGHFPGPVSYTHLTLPTILLV